MNEDSPAVVHVGSERLCTLIISQNLSRTCGGHGCNQEGVAHSMLGNLLLQTRPVPSAAGCDAPHIELELSLGRWRACVGLVRSLFLGELHRGLACTKVDGFEDVLVAVVDILQETLDCTSTRDGQPLKKTTVTYS